ncbi:hypothetical protein MMC13_005133 [Lambiella insularis]|nr:hypothetical protein [Lambiella insularis]
MHLSLSVSLIASAFTLVSSRAVNGGRNTRPRAAYTLDNDAAGAAIVALDIGLDDGKLYSPVRTSTGGVGRLGNTATGSSGPDGLFGQSAVVVSEDVRYSVSALVISSLSRVGEEADRSCLKYLFTVNPGSNTVSMFSINKDDPTDLCLVGEPASTLGEFPTSVAYSSHLKTVCAVSGGAINGVTCFSVDHEKGLTLLDQQPRSMSPALMQTTPPVGPPGTSSDLFFNPSSTALFGVVKGDPGTSPATASTWFAWPVVDGKVSTTAVISQIPDLLVNFGGNFVNDDTIASIDASFGVAILKVSPTFQITEEVHTVVPGQVAICWGAYAPRFETFYAPDTGSTVVTEIDPATGAIKEQWSYDPSAGNPFDFAIDRTWMYVLTGNASVVVIDLEGSNHGKVPYLVQNLDISEGGSKKMYQGMATYPK